MARDLRLQINIRVPDWGRRGWTLAAVLALLVGGAVVYANVMWTPFQQGEKLTSAKMNANFKSLADAIDTINAQMPQGTKLPHLILNQGNVDLGVYLGPVPGTGTAMVFSQALNAPIALATYSYDLSFTGANCTGTAYTTKLPIGFGNSVFNTPSGTIFRAGAAQGYLYASYKQNWTGQCTNVLNPIMVMGYPLEDTKVANVPGLGGTDTSILFK